MFLDNSRTGFRSSGNVYSKRHILSATRTGSNGSFSTSECTLSIDKSLDPFGSLSSEKPSLVSGMKYLTVKVEISTTTSVHAIIELCTTKISIVYRVWGYNYYTRYLLTSWTVLLSIYIGAFYTSQAIISADYRSENGICSSASRVISELRQIVKCCSPNIASSAVQKLGHTTQKSLSVFSKSSELRRKIFFWR